MNINVRNLSPTTSREELLDCFTEYGSVSDVSVSTYTVKGIWRATGLVEMPSSVQGQASIDALQGKELDGNLLDIYKE
ncbi:MAG: RNA-binding protein [Candidatus Zixiibacteriota bacterium]|jgi:RNA recognition motif-containing protein